MSLQGTQLEDAYGYSYGGGGGGGGGHMEINRAAQPEQPIQYQGKSMSTPLANIQQGGGGDQKTDVLMKSPMSTEYVYNNPNREQMLEQKLQKALLLLQSQKQRVEQMKVSAEEKETENGYFEKMGSKKRDITKLFLMACIILLALSMHSLCEFYIQQLIQDHHLSFRQKLVTRIIYPIMVMLLLWNTKAIFL